MNMKAKRNIAIALLMMLLFLQAFIYAQQDSVSKPVKDFWQLMNQFSTRYNGKDNFVKNYSANEIDTLTKKYYIATSEDPIGFKLKIEGEYYGLDSLARNNKGLTISHIPKIGLMKEIISSKYGKNFSEIISVPYYLKVTIISDSGSIFEGPINTRVKNNPHNIFRTSQGNLLAKVEDVIKGKRFFKVGQNIIISYLTFWIAEGRKFFQKGKTYFIPLKPWGLLQGYSKITIDILPDNNYAIYPVENGSISTPGNYFGFGETEDWNLFKQEFTKKYILN